MKKKKVVIIDAENQEVRDGFVSSLGDMQKIVGGLICIAYDFESGDTLFVNDEGLLMDPKYGFYIHPYKQPLMLNGFIIGPTDDDGDSTDVQMSAEDIEGDVKFFKVKNVSQVGGGHL